MKRLSFLKALAILPFAPGLIERLLSRPPYLHQTYCLGFEISNEMLQNDIYTSEGWWAPAEPPTWIAYEFPETGRIVVQLVKPVG